MRPSTVHVEQTKLAPTIGIAVRDTVPVDELPRFFTDAFHELGEAVRAAGARVMGPPFARYHTAPPGPVDVEVMFPVDIEVPARGRAKSVSLEGGEAIQAMHIGSYDSLGAVYEELQEFMNAHALQADGPPREIYLTGPDVEPSRIRTLVVQPTREASP